MNSVLTYLRRNRQRLNLERYDVPERLTCLILTPRFRASSHVVFLVMPKGRPDPILVAKVPRLVDATTGLECEVENLRAVQACRPGGFDSIPRVVAFDEYSDRPILIETALVGQPMDRATVRRDLAGCCDAVTDWLAELHAPVPGFADTESDWFHRVVERPLVYFEEMFPMSTDEGWLLERTWELVAPLRGINLPLVVEHGDLSHPNVMLLQDGGAGVVDWELAKPRGLPACDLFFFLTYAAFALRDARSSEDYLAAFQDTFFGPSAWSRSYVAAYAERLQLPQETLTPLFILTWARYVTGLLIRLNNVGEPKDAINHDVVAWLRGNRYYKLWQYALAHLNGLDWSGPLAESHHSFALGGAVTRRMSRPGAG